MLNKAGKSGPCAKRDVKCTIVTSTGEHIVGFNYCNNAQNECPRLPGEGYDKCKTICLQPGHAEEMALLRAGDRAIGSRVYIEGISHVCRSCQEKLKEAGVMSFTLGPPSYVTVARMRRIQHV